MIRPTKYMRVQTCTLSVAALLLSRLNRVAALPLTEIEDLVSSTLGEAARVNTHRAINMLFLFGTVRYDEDIDALVYIPAAERRQP